MAPARTAEEEAALEAKMDEMVFKLQARVEASEDVWNSRKTRKVVRLSREECEKIMAIAPWPPVIPAALYEDRYAGLRNIEIIEKVRANKAKTVEYLKLLHAEWARVRKDYAAHGYADMAVEIDEHGDGSIVRWEE